MDDIYNQDPTNLAIIRYHTWWPGANDPYYRANVEENDNRIFYYGVNYTPDLWIDGDIHGGSGYGSWGYYISNEEGASSPLTIDLAANYGQTGDFGTITAVINATAPVTQTNLKTRFVITESHLPPYGAFDEFNHVMRDMVPDAAGIDLVISQGQEVTKDATFTISGDWNLAELAFIVFVQSDDNHEILQASKLIPPTGVLRGRVLNQENGFIVPDASLTVLNTSYGDSTDSGGGYAFPFFQGSWSVIVSSAGFHSDTVDVVIIPDDTTDLDISLQPVTSGSITGTVRDASTLAPLLARVTLFQNGDPLATVETDTATGTYAFNGLVTSSPSVAYTDLSADVPIPYGVVSYGDTVTVVEGSPAVVDFDVSPAHVLLVDDDEGETYEDYFKDAITAAGRRFYHFDVHATGESAADYIHLFPAGSITVWFTGDASSNTLTPTDQDTLAVFLDRGGRLFLTGQNIIEDLAGSGSLFLQDYLHVGHGGNAPTIWARNVEGNPIYGDPDIYLTTGNGGANNQTSRDILVPTPPATDFVHYVSSPSDPSSLGTAAVYCVDPQNESRTVLMGFGFESISHLGGGSDRASREETMQGILDWLDGIVGIGDDDGRGGEIALPGAMTLYQNYPNPFNPSTTIRYAIPESRGKREGSRNTTPVRLTLYDLRGRLIRTLVDVAQPPGRYAVQWDGRDEQDRRVGSGVYLYRIEAGKQVLTRKMAVQK